MKCPQTLEVGVYVLGALSPAEREAFERHLGECAFCREEVADLAVLPGLLGRLDAKTAAAVARDGEASSALLGGGVDATGEPGRWAGPTAAAGWAGPTAAAESEAAESAESTEPAAPVAGAGDAERATERVDHPRWAGPTVSAGPAEAVGTDQAGSAGPDRGDNVVSLLEAAQRRRSREKRQRRFATAATILVAACLALVVGFGASFLVDKESGPALDAMRQVASAPVTAEVGFEPMTSGTKVIMHCTYKTEANAGVRWDFRLFVVPKSGGPAEEVGTWSAGHGDDIRLTTTTSIKPDDIARVELRGRDGSVLLVLNL